MAEIAAAVLAGIILLGGAVKAFPAVWGFVKAVGRAPVVLERMYAEFSPNGGSSLRDAVDRQAEGLTAILEWQDAHSADDVEQFASVRQDATTLDEYTHKRMHDVLNQLTVISARLHNMEQRQLAADDDQAARG